jgi:hypothetical protein
MLMFGGFDGEYFDDLKFISFGIKFENNTNDLPHKVKKIQRTIKDFKGLNYTLTAKS